MVEFLVVTFWTDKKYIYLKGFIGKRRVVKKFKFVTSPFNPHTR
jgi:hypothetical protein